MSHDMKIAIIHDYFDKRGGGERLVINLARALDADLYTGFIEKEKTFDMSGLRVHNLGVRGFGLHRRIKIARAFEKFRFPEYDAYLFSGVWCISASHNRPNFLYLHTPMRAIYDLREYFSSRGIADRIFLRIFSRYWMPKDRAYIRGFDVIGTNSENVRNRVMKYYGKDVYERTRVVYTGIETKKYRYKKSGDFYLSASRLDPLKRIDMIINVFKKTDRKLVIAGSGSDEGRLKKLAAGCNNIVFLGQVSDERLRDLYATCRATIAANMNEDLGLIAIESHASGKPIVAVKEGGFLETVNKDNGVFFTCEKDMEKAIEKLEKTKWNYKKIQSTAKRFDVDVFSRKIKSILMKA
jgi:glycosyltransferase involved in cell wall biosynthesis